MTLEQGLFILVAASMLIGAVIAGVYFAALQDRDVRRMAGTIITLERLLKAAQQERDALREYCALDLAWRDVQSQCRDYITPQEDEDFESEGWRTDPERWRERKL